MGNASSGSGFMNQKSKHELEHSQYTIRILDTESVVEFHFAEQEKAQSLFNVLRSIFPLVDTQYPTLAHDKLVITTDQYHFYRLYLSHERKDVLYQLIPDHYFLKTLRADEFDFSHAFIKGLIPGEEGQRRQNLRPSERKPFIINTDGMVDVRLTRLPKHKSTERADYSQIQSCTFIDEETQSGAFGFAQARADRLFGLMTHEGDLIIHKGLIRDSGTVGRVFEFDDWNEASNSHFNSAFSGEKILYPPSCFADFKRRNLQVRATERRTNEFLARLRFNPHRSVVCVCSKTLEARLLAYHFAQELLDEYKRYASRNNIPVNPNYKIPIVFYLQRDTSKLPSTAQWQYTHVLSVYTEGMQRIDQEEALSIYNTPQLRKEKFTKKDYEFLLGLEEITSDILLEEVISDHSLAEHLLRCVRGRLLMKLFESRSTKKSEVIHTVFTTLASNGRITRNDSLISELIKIEAFDIASDLILKTHSKKSELIYEKEKLSQWILQYGNARHMNFMGLSKMLKMAANKGAWTIIKLCLKEYPGINKTIIGELLVQAFMEKRRNEVRFLLKMGADKTAEAKTVFQQSINERDHGLITVFLNYDIKIDYNYYRLLVDESRPPSPETSLLDLFKLVKKHYPEKYYDFICFSIRFAIDAFIDVGVVKSIIDTQHSAESFIRLSYDLALCSLSDSKAIVAMLKHNYSYILNKPDLLSEREVGQLFIEAFLHHGKEFAEYQLKKYCDKDIVKSFIILIPYLPVLFRNLQDTEIQKFREDFFPHLWEAIHKIASVKQLNQENLVILTFKDFKRPGIVRNVVSGCFPHKQSEYPKVDGVMLTMTSDQYYLCSLNNSLKKNRRLKGKFIKQYVLKSFQANELTEFNEFFRLVTQVGQGQFSKKYSAVRLGGKPLQIDQWTDIPESEYFYIGLLFHIDDTVICSSEEAFTHRIEARFRFNPYRTLVVYGTRDLGAVYFAMGLMDSLKNTYSNSEFKLPIINYTPVRVREKTFNKVKSYVDPTLSSICEKEQQCRKNSALSIFWNKGSRHEHYRRGHYEFLLSLEEFNASILFERPNKGYTVAVLMIIDRKTWILRQLINKLPQGLTVDFIDALFPMSSNELGDVIGELILNEEFEFAQRLIEKSAINVTTTTIRHQDILYYLNLHGNPCQLNFTGFKETLPGVAYQGRWKTIRKCITEFPAIDKSVLTGLLLEAIKQGVTREVRFLLQSGADVNSRLFANTPIVGAAQLKKWEIVSVFADFPTDEYDSAEYGYALLNALCDKEVIVAKKLLSAGAKPFCREFQNGLDSTLYYAVQHGLNELLPALINFESQSEHAPVFYSRCLIARDLAHATHNTEAAQMLDKFIGHHSPIDADNRLLSIARVFLQALYFENIELAKYRLLFYLEKDVLAGLSEVLPYIESVAHELPRIALEQTQIKYLQKILRLLIENDGLNRLLPMFQSGCRMPLFYSRGFYRALLELVTENNLKIVSEIATEIVRDEKRKSQWQEILNTLFHQKVISSDHAISYCLARLGAEPTGDKDETTFDIAAFDGNEKVVRYILENFNVDQETKNRALHKSTFTGWASVIPALLLQHDAELSPEILISAVRHGGDYILDILAEVDADILSSNEYANAIFVLWCASYKHSKLQQKLSEAFDAHTIMYLSLLHIWVITCNSLKGKELVKINDLFYQRTKIPPTYLFLDVEYEYEYKVNKVRCSLSESLESLYDIIIVQRNFFCQKERELSETQLCSELEHAYQAVRLEINALSLSSIHHRLSSISVPFFKPKETLEDFTTSIQAYLRRVDSLLAKKCQVKCDDDSVQNSVTDLKLYQG